MSKKEKLLVKIDNKKDEVLIIKENDKYPLYSLVSLYKSVSQNLIKSGIAVDAKTLVDFLFTIDYQTNFAREIATISIKDAISYYNAKIGCIINSLNEKDLLSATELNRYKNKEKCYIVDAKGGHIEKGKWVYYEMNIPISAQNVEEARAKAILTPRVKRHKEEDILRVTKVSPKKYEDQIIANSKNPYYKTKEKDSNYKKKKTIKAIKDKIIDERLKPKKLLVSFVIQENDLLVKLKKFENFLKDELPVILRVQAYSNTEEIIIERILKRFEQISKLFAIKTILPKKEYEGYMIHSYLFDPKGVNHNDHKKTN